MKPSILTQLGGTLFACVFLVYAFVNLQRGQWLWVFIGVYTTLILMREVLRTHQALFHIRITPEALLVRDVVRRAEFKWESLGAFRVQRVGFQKAIFFGWSDNPKPIFPIIVQSALINEKGQTVTLEETVAILNAQRDLIVSEGRSPMVETPGLNA